MFYDPDIGRLLALDRISQQIQNGTAKLFIDASTPKSQNLYSYCSNDPVNRVDTLGAEDQLIPYKQLTASDFPVVQVAPGGKRGDAETATVFKPEVGEIQCIVFNNNQWPCTDPSGDNNKCCFTAQCQFTNPKVTTFFNKSQSWAKAGAYEGTQGAQLLKHEQGHLDITLIIAKMFQEDLEDALGTKCSCKSERIAIALAKAELLKQANDYFEVYKKMSVSATVSYDDFVDHYNLDPKKQDIASKQYQDLLTKGWDLPPVLKARHDKAVARRKDWKTYSPNTFRY